MALSAAGALSSACTQVPREYACTVHAQCSADLAEGRCELTGYCSDADPSCPSGRSYVADLAGPVSGTCVPGELPKWLRTIGGVGNDRPAAVTVDAAGDPIAYGTFQADLQGEVTGSSVGLSDLLLVSFDRASGEVGWTLQGQGAQADQATDIVWTGTMTLRIAGYTNGSLQFGTATIEPTAPGGDGFVAQFSVDPDPVLQMGAYTEGSASEEVRAIGQGSLVAGTFSGGSLAIAGATLDADSAGEDGWVADIAPNGTSRWAVTFGGAVASDRISVSAVGGSSSTALVAGSFSGSVTLPGDGSATTSRGGTDGFVFLVNGVSGAASGAAAVGGQGDDLVHDVATDEEMQTWLAGSVEGPAQFGGTPSEPLGVRDAFVYRASGGFVWRVGVAGRETEAVAITVDASEQLIVVGTFEETLELGGGVSLTGQGGRDVFVCELSPDTGAVTWATSFGGPGDDEPMDVAVLPSGDVVVLGSFSGTADFGGVSRTVVGENDWFIAALPNR